MARSFTSISATSAAALMTAVNTYLAALTNPIIRGFWPQAIYEQRRLGTEYVINLDTDSGGSAISTPWLLNVQENNDLPDFITAVQAFETAQLVSGFCSAARLLFIDVTGRSRLYSAFNLYNTTAGASANFLLL